LATVDPDMPVIDSIVLRNLNVRLPVYGGDYRRDRLVELHAGLLTSLTDFLTTDVGRYLVGRFRALYPNADVTKIKDGGPCVMADQAQQDIAHNVNAATHVVSRDVSRFWGCRRIRE
jgi:hypothetical protein